MPLERLISRRQCFALGVFVWMYLDVTNAFAACPIVLQPLDADTPWKAAAIAAEKQLGEHKDTPQDCRSVTIEVQREGNALLTFTTVDGRVAARLLHTPEDIPATLEALLVTLPLAPQLVSRPSAPSPRVDHVPAKPETPPAHRETTVAVPEKPITPNTPPPIPRFVVGVATGVRWGVDEMIFAPALLLHGSFVLSSWEIGVRGEWNPTYKRLLGQNPAGFRMYSLAANLTIGRREKRRRMEMRYGITMGLAGVHEDIDVNPAVRGDIGVDTFEPLAGAYIGLVVPREKRFRFSLGLAFDAALSGLKESATKLRGLPALPRFGLGLSIGMEVWP